MAGVQGAARPQSRGNGLSSERLCQVGGVEFRGLASERSEARLESHYSHTRADGVYRCPQVGLCGVSTSGIDGLQLNVGKDTWCFEYESTVMFLSLMLDGRLKEALITAPVLVRPMSGKEVVICENSAMATHEQDIAEGKPTEFQFRDEGVLCFKDRMVVPMTVSSIGWVEERCCQVGEQMCGLSESEGRTSVSVGIVATIEDSGMEVGEDHYGFCDGIAVDTFEERLCMGYSDRFTKFAHFLPVHITYTLDKLAGQMDSQSGLFSYQASIQMAPYEALYGRRCRTPVYWAEAGHKLLQLPDILKSTIEKVKLISERSKTTSDRQKPYADLKHRGIEYVVGDRVFMKVSPWKKPLGKGKMI
ncbi:hypothetical protein V6N13_091061 [Hibiscus sabdariffa]